MALYIKFPMWDGACIWSFSWLYNDPSILHNLCHVCKWRGERLGIKNLVIYGIGKVHIEGSSFGSRKFTVIVISVAKYYPVISQCVVYPTPSFNYVHKQPRVWWIETPREAQGLGETLSVCAWWLAGIFNWLFPLNGLKISKYICDHSCVIFVHSGRFAFKLYQ